MKKIKKFNESSIDKRKIDEFYKKLKETSRFSEDESEDSKFLYYDAQSLDIKVSDINYILNNYNCDKTDISLLRSCIWYLQNNLDSPEFRSTNNVTSYRGKDYYNTYDREPKNNKINIIKEKVKENVNDLIENLQSTLEIISDINDNSGLGKEIIDLYQKLSDFNKKLDKF